MFAMYYINSMCKNYLLLCSLILPLCFYSQKLCKGKNFQLSAIGFWNVENLYDTINDRWKNDEEFTPAGTNAWTARRYQVKLDHLADVISRMATDILPDGLSILGLCEVENKSVVEDLVNSEKLRQRNYKVVHLEGPDARGVDPSFIYNPVYLKVTKTIAFNVKLATDSSHKTRHILGVSGFFMGEPVLILVNHWPSRRGGELASRPNRQAAAKVVRRISDSVMNVSPKTKIIVMGDFNDDPTSESVKKVIGTVADSKQSPGNLFYNPMENLHQMGIGTLAWQDSWNLFDQVLLSAEWVTGNYEYWQFYGARVFNKDFLKCDFGKYKGYPLRTYSGPNYTGGYSDHFPVYVVIAREKKK